MQCMVYEHHLRLIEMAQGTRVAWCEIQFPWYLCATCSSGPCAHGQPQVEKNIKKYGSALIIINTNFFSTHRTDTDACVASLMHVSFVMPQQELLCSTVIIRVILLAIFRCSDARKHESFMEIKNRIRWVAVCRMDQMSRVAVYREMLNYLTGRKLPAFTGSCDVEKCALFVRW